MKAVERKPSLKGAMTPQEFCTAFRVSEELYDALRRVRIAPREVSVGADRKKLITLQDAAEWRVSVEPMRQFARRWLSRSPG